MRQLLNVYQMNQSAFYQDHTEIPGTKGIGVQFDLELAEKAANLLLQMFDLRSPRPEDFPDDGIEYYREVDWYEEKIKSKAWYNKESVELAWQEAQASFHFFTNDGADLSIEALSDFAHAAYGKQCDILGVVWDKEDVPRIRVQTLPD